MAHRIQSQEISAQFRSYSSSHPMLDYLNESFIGVKLYNVDKNADILGEDVVILTTIPNMKITNRYCTTFYDSDNTSTLLCLYNVQEPRLPPLAHVLTYTNHWYQYLTLQRLERQPTYTVARPFILSQQLRNFIFELQDTVHSKEITKSGYKMYQNANVKIYVSGGDSPGYTYSQTAFKLLNNPGTVIVARDSFIYSA